MILISRPAGVVLSTVGIDLLDQLSVMRSILVQPEHGWRLPSPSHGSRPASPNPESEHPSPGTCARYRLLRPCAQQGLARRIHDADRAVTRRLEGLVVRAVLLPPPAPSSRRWECVPMVFGSKAPFFLQNSTTLVIDRRIAGVRNHALHVLQLAFGFHIFPESRMTGGMEASMMMSLGTWRLVMPLSLFTIAIGGRFW